MMELLVVWNKLPIFRNPVHTSKHDGVQKGGRENWCPPAAKALPLTAQASIGYPSVIKDTKTI